LNINLKFAYMIKMNKYYKILILLLVITSVSCAQKYEVLTRKVTATAYNSFRYQTSSHPNLAAWGDSLKPGMKAIAVSRDLLTLGLTHNVEVEIEGLEGTYLVLDKMNKEWTNRIDIYMGTDLKAADKWGKKEVTISWKVKVKKN